MKNVRESENKFETFEFIDKIRHEPSFIFYLAKFSFKQ